MPVNTQGFWLQRPLAMIVALPRLPLSVHKFSFVSTHPAEMLFDKRSSTGRYETALPYFGMWCRMMKNRKADLDLKSSLSPQMRHLTPPRFIFPTVGGAKLAQGASEALGQRRAATGRCPWC